MRSAPIDALPPAPLTPATDRPGASQAVLAAMLRQGPVSRAELSRITGLSKQTTSEVVRGLVAEGWAGIHGQIQGALGRSAVTYQLRHDVALVLGIDLGGTKLHAALADLRGGIVAEDVQPTDRRGGRHIVAQLGAMTARLLHAAGKPARSLQGAALGSPGVVQPGSGRILFAPNIPGLDRIDLAASLQARLGCPVQIENDVNLAAIGEQWQGRGRGARTFAFVALGTGIGMGMVADGRLLRGARGAAGEIAYLPLGGDPFDSRGARLGTLETAIGSAAILDRYRALGGAPLDDVRAMFGRLDQHDPAATATLDETARLLAQACMAIRALLDPELIVFGGSIGARLPLLDRVRRILAAHMPDPVPVEPTALGPRAAIMGGISLAAGRLQHRLFGAAMLSATP